VSGLVLRYLAYLGPNRTAADVSFEPGLNVICGASETGKSYVAESIDFMLGQESPVRDIPERAGYDRLRLKIECEGWPALLLERSIEGGNFRTYEEVGSDQPKDATVLRWKHSGARQDTLSHALLERIGLSSRRLRRNSRDQSRSLSFRDLARVVIVNETEIQKRSSPLLSGQFVSATSEYAAFKFLLTGTDDSALVSSVDKESRRELEGGKIELLDEWIHELRSSLEESGADENEITEQLSRLESTIEEQNAALVSVQRTLNSLLERRGVAARQVRDRRARLLEIAELVARFTLLDQHYQTDLRRLEAIHESGSLFVHLDAKACPLCGAEIGAQHLDGDCDGNTDSVVQAAQAEMQKIHRLRSELGETLSSLQLEQREFEGSLAGYESQYRRADEELSQVVAPAVSEERASYNALITRRAELQAARSQFDRLHQLIAQRTEIEVADGDAPSSAGSTQISKTVLDSFSQTVQQILSDWHFPNATRVFFDESKRDFVIAGKERGSTGKGLRAITHAAVTIGLMVFCRENDLPHPGFVVLDSPLLAYWKPEGVEDDLRGTDLKERFYEYLLGLKSDLQVVIMENEHPPDAVIERANVLIFTKNFHQGRYGFFPHIEANS
jgi:predicted nuclease with TOPRIM domain